MNRYSHTANRSTATGILGITALVMVVLIILTLWVWLHGQQTRRCHNLGGTVVTDHDTHRVTDRKTGRTTTKTTTEYECVVDGREVFEW